jgi:hypothetical protein
VAKSSYKPIPVGIATRIAEEFSKAQVVILAWDPEHQLTHTVTYGVSAFDKENAAAMGEICTQAIGGDLSKRHTFEDFHRDYDPALYKEALDLLALIRGRNGCTPHMVQEAERILRAAGRGVRQG